MAVQYIGKLENPQEGTNQYANLLQDTLMKERAASASETNTMQEILARKQIEAAKMQQEYDEKQKENFDMTIELLVDKYGRKEAARRLKDDVGLKEVYKGYKEYHPEYKNIESIEATLPMVTRKEIDMKMTEATKRLEEDLRAKRLPDAQDLAQMTVLAQIARDNKMMKEDEYKAVIGTLTQLQKGVIARMGAAGTQQTSALAQPSNQPVTTNAPDFMQPSPNAPTNINWSNVNTANIPPLPGNAATEALAGSTQYQNIKPKGKIKSFKRIGR